MFNCKKIFVFLMFALFAAQGAAVAADKKVERYSLLDSLEISLESDSYYNSTNDNITSETGIVFDFRDFTFDVTPTVTSDDMSMTDVKLGLAYSWQYNDNISLVPYTEKYWDDDFDSGDTVIGLKTIIKLY